MSWEATHAPTDGTLEGRAEVLDLTRRVALLERGLHGHTAPELSLVLMLRCYRDAHAMLKGIDPQSAAVWLAQAYLWNVRMLIELGRAVLDPYPFRPLLAVLDLCVLQGVPSASDARRRFEEVAQDLLKAMGLELVRPRDVMHQLQMDVVREQLSRR